ncbi:MAG: hypothetical protein KA248_03635 [Kiritimatiellae bacterium]|nr:hypothetical protein [Kiritimatiellia bacterium]
MKTGIIRLMLAVLGSSLLASCARKTEPPPPVQVEEEAVVAEPEIEEGPVRTAYRGDTPLRDIAIVPSPFAGVKSQTLVAVGESHTILRSTDDGATWSPVALRRPDAPDLSAVLFPNTDHGWILSRDQVLHSADRGATWTPAAVPERGFYYFGAISAVGSGCYLIQPPTCGATVYRTDDGGAGWTALAGGLPRNDYGAVHFRNARRGWVVGAYGRFAFTGDGGATWQTKEFSSEMNFAELEMVTDEFGWMRADRGHAGRLWLTRNGGADWTTVNLGVESYWSIVDVDFLDPQTGLALVQKGSDGSRVLLSRDAGATWAAWMDVKPVLTAMAFRDLERGWFTGADGRIYKTVPAP